VVCSETDRILRVVNDGLRWCVELAAVLIVLALVMALYGPAWATRAQALAHKAAQARRPGAKPISAQRVTSEKRQR
jgi:hypothetical protein